MKRQIAESAALKFACLMFVLLLTLSACGVGQFLIKRSVLSLESDIAKEFKSYARFNEQQEQQIDQIAAMAARWVRSERLPILSNELEKLALNIESDGQVSESNWRTFTLFMEDPFELSEASDLIDSMANVVFGMDEDQISQALKKIKKEYAKESRELAKRTADDEIDDIADALKTIFAELGIKRSREQLKQARLALAERKSYLAFDMKSDDEQYQRFSALLASRGDSKADFIRRFKQAWFDSDRSPKEMMPSDWEHNFMLSHSVMNTLMTDLNSEQRAKSASKIREYAALFEELSQTE